MNDETVIALPDIRYGCLAEYDTAIRSGVDGLRQAIRALQPVADRVRFRASH